jgi:Zn-dependent protease
LTTGIDFQPDYFVATMIALILGVTVHEFMHAWSALKLGDTTAYYQGRVTLNPSSHFDPLGFILMVFLALGIGILAWGRPVPVNPNRLQWGRQGFALTALAGPASNLVLASLVALPVRLGEVELIGFPGLLIEQIIFINLLLTAFNLVPIPPLDGSKILAGILPAFWWPYLARLEQYGFGILLILILFGQFFSGESILGSIYAPVFIFLERYIVGPLPL